MNAVKLLQAIGSYQPRPRSWGAREWLSALLLSPLAFASGAYTSERVWLHERALPGISVAGAKVTGYAESELSRHVQHLNQILRQRTLQLQVGDQQFETSAAHLGLGLDVPATTRAILTLGRRGSLWQRLRWRWDRFWTGEQAAELVLQTELSTLTQQLTAWERQALTEPVEGDVVLYREQLTAVLPRSGARLEQEQARATLERLFTSPQTTAPLPLLETTPRLSTAEVERALTTAQRLTARPLRLVSARVGERSGAEVRSAPPLLAGALETQGQRDPPLGPPAAARFSPEDLRRALRTELVQPPARLEFFFDPEVVEAVLAPQRPAVEVPPRDARFEVDHYEKLTLVPSESGSRVDETRVPALLLELAESEDGQGPAPMVVIEPTWTSAKTEALQLQGLVTSFTTRHPCCMPRVHNIHRIADLLQDTLLGPGERFSLNETVGERTRSRGFVEAPTIVEGEIEDTLGGGISQFATTLFNAVLDGGYEIVERQPHTFYFERYPIGHEATVSFPKPDLIFRNDTPAGLLIKTVYTGTFIQVKLYGDNQGRSVRRERSPHFDILQPGRRFEADDTLPPEEDRILTPGQIGFSVFVSRILTEANGESREEKRKVIYSPRDEVLAVHPCRLPREHADAVAQPCPPRASGAVAATSTAETSTRDTSAP